MDCDKSLSVDETIQVKSDASVMDSDSSGGERSKKRRKLNNDDVEAAKESVEEVPKILSPEIHDVFHVFASMLDVKSFLRLAMTSKDMYKRCMEDKQIKISVNLNNLSITRRHGTMNFDLPLSGVCPRYSNEYFAALRKLPCEVNMGLVCTSCETNGEILASSRRYLEEIGVKRIQELMIDFDDDFTDSEAIIKFIKDFNVSSLLIDDPRPNDALLLIIRSFLQLNLKKFCLDGRIPIDFILEIESSIPELSFPEVYVISKEQLEQILSRIQSGSVRRLTVNMDAVDWDNYEKLSFDHKGPLPEDRPLLFARNDPEIAEYWFLHWDGGVTKLVRERVEFEMTLRIFKCEPWELPCALRKNEEILKDLAEKRPRVCCTSEQFHNFTAGFTMLDPSHKGSLPDGRPLYCKDSENRFWMLNEDENLMGCDWEYGRATWEWYNPRKPKVIEHPALKKYMFWKVLKQVKKYELFYYCEGLNELDSWLEDFENLDFDYSGELPSTRPLVFKGKKMNSRIVLLEDRLVECEFCIDTVNIRVCYCLNRPPILITASILVEILKDPDHKSMNFNISFDVFRDGLQQLEKSAMVLQKRLLIVEKTETEYWYRNAEVVWKVEWKDGRISISKALLRESPPLFLKQIFRCLVEKCSPYSMTLELEQFRECLEQFKVVPFDYSGPLKNDSPMAFVKNEIRHTCRNQGRCQCSKVSSVLVWFLVNGLRWTQCSWGRNGAKLVELGLSSDCLDEMPAMLQKSGKRSKTT